jgi:hypothetical protein
MVLAPERGLKWSGLIVPFCPQLLISFFAWECEFDEFGRYNGAQMFTRGEG